MILFCITHLKRRNMLSIQINSTSNSEFLNYILKKSTYGMFILPNFRQKGFCNSIKLNKDYNMYRKNCNSLIEAVYPKLIKNYVDKKVFNSKYSHVLDIYVFQITKEFRLEAIEYGALSQWLYPNLPEDLCLFDENKNCLLFTQTHEDICCIYGESEKERALFKSWGLNYQIAANEFDNRNEYNMSMLKV